MRILGALLMCVFFSTLSMAEDDTSEFKSVLDKLQAIDQKEIAIGQLAEQSGTKPEIKNYGKKLVKDHTDLDNKLAKYAKDHNFELTKPEPAGLTTLQSLSGKDFDKKFVDDMVEGHKEAIEMVKKAQADTKDVKFKAFLASVLPSFHNHEVTAEKLEKTL